MILRRCLFAMWVVSFLLLDTAVLARLPAGWVPRDALLLTGVRLAGIGLAAAAIVWRSVALPAAVAVTVNVILGESMGHVGHTEIMALFATWVVAVARDEETARPVIAALLVLGYACSAAYRMAFHPIATVSGATIYNVAVERSLSEGSGALAGVLLARPWLAAVLQAGAGVATLVELASPVALLSIRFRRVWVPAIVFFHVVNAYLLAVVFWKQALLVVVVFAQTLREQPR